jgi:tetratricopeptide (TPR) repeat protein
VDKFSVQARLDLGDRDRAANRKRADELYAEGLRQFSLGQLDKAIELWTEVLKIDAKYTPARKYRAIAETTRKAQEEARKAGTGQ